MPTYEYECKTCGGVFDVFQSITAKPLRRSACEKCGRVQSVRRLIGTGGALIFKGSGFYLTDYRSDGYKKDQKSDSEAGTKKNGDGKEASTPKTADSTQSDSVKSDSAKTDSAKTESSVAAGKKHKSKGGNPRATGSDHRPAQQTGE